MDYRGNTKFIAAWGPFAAGGLALVMLAPHVTFPPLPAAMLCTALAVAGGTRVYAFVQGGHQTLSAAVQLPAMVILGPVPAALCGSIGYGAAHWFRRTSPDGTVFSAGQRIVATLVAGIAWSTLIEGHPVLHRPSAVEQAAAPLLAVIGALLAYALTSALLVAFRYASARRQPVRFILSTNAVWDVTGTMLVGASGLALALPFTGLALRQELDSIIGVVLLCLSALLYIFRRQTIVEAAGLREAVVDLLRTPDLDELLARLADRLAPIARPDALWIALRQSGGRHKVVLARGVDAGAIERLCAEPAGSGLGWTLELRGVTCIDDFRKDHPPSPAVNTIIGPGKLRSLLVAPLLAGDELLGSLVLTKTVAAFFTPFQQQNVGTLAAQAALMMKTVSLSHATGQQLQRMHALETISEQINSQHDLTTLFSLLAASARDVLGADRCSVALGAEGGATTEMFARGLSDDYLRVAEHVRRDVTMAQLAMKTREPVVVTDVFTDPRAADIRDAAKREGFRTLAVFPLRYEGRAIGTLRLYHDAVRPYEPPDVALGIAFANQAAIAVQNSRLLREAHLRAHQLGLVNRVITRVATVLRPEELFETLVHELHSTLGYPFVLLVLVDGERLHAPAYRGYTRAPSLDVHRGIIGRVARTRRAELVEDVLHDPDYVVADPRVRQQACVPIFRDDHLVGLISVEVIDPTLTRADLDMLTALASEVTETMRNASLFEEVRQARDELHALSESSRALSKSLELSTILDGLVAGTCRRFGYRGGAILLTDPAGDLVVRAVHGDSRALGERVALGQGAEGRAAQKTRAVLLTDPGPPAGGARRVPVLAVPLLREDSVIGVFRVSGDEGGMLGERDMRVLTTLAGYCAVAIENARLYERTRDLASTDGLTGLVNHRAFWQAMAGELERAKRYAVSLSLVVVEIDRFKQYNDRYGHLRGDEVLRLVARALLKEHRQQIDTVARYGGDEFTLLLPHTDKAGAAAVAERIRLAIEATPFIVGTEVTSVSVSLGVAAFPEDAETTSALVDMADRRMYVAKRSGGNSVAPITP